MESLHWEDLKDRTVRAIECRSRNKKEAPFRFQSASIFEESDPHQKWVQQPRSLCTFSRAHCGFPPFFSLQAFP